MTSTRLETSLILSHSLPGPVKSRPCGEHPSLLAQPAGRTGAGGRVGWWIATPCNRTHGFSLRIDATDAFIRATRVVPLEHRASRLEDVRGVLSERGSTLDVDRIRTTLRLLEDVQP
ncbi:MAG: hypothetical protein AB7I50_25155 [Vicinamibacterales bacterium]